MTTTDDLEMRRGLAAQLTGLNIHTAHEWSMTFTDEGNDPLWREIMALDTIEADDLQSASTPHLSMSAITIHEPSSAETTRSVPSVAPGVASPRMAVPSSGDFSHWFHREIILRMQSRGPSTLNEQHGQDNNSTQTGLLHAH
ncbi:hypothetical protein SDRG_04584 [Saprolegnia diclina VS20]|uniref:Uncharacterized protein n=1 Tax=Saprolegnia diclina (strain VS20) TaxID=1156394 RepID=T0QVU5_SAPDV|nr:hypothetical protein SDRG_04584 [Saprolegnia diclina VS20]EQC38155.1 hypothetical protein SDRG_04584 [Saprolegnia diclina VS20]|eukprot:XP_008608482.1 hypothetical protein SDRG_04584 [Saprolegnia diclina VS20]